MGERLGAIDEAYLLMEEPNTPLHVASVGIFERDGLCAPGGRLRLDAIRQRIDNRLDLMPRLRQRVLPMPLGIGRPVWVDDDRFDIANHIDAVALGRPNDEAALLRLVEQLLMTPLDRSHPLWHLRFVTGLESGRVALVERAHHAMVDGVSGVDVSLVIFDSSPDAPEPEESRWTPEPLPSARDLVVDVAVEALTQPARIARGVLRAARDPRRTAAVTVEMARSVATLQRTGVIAPPSSLRGRLGPSRQLAVIRQRLDTVRSIATKHDATINDVALTAVAGGLRELFVERGEALPTGRTANVLVPVSVRSRTEANALGNRVGGLVTPLPIGIGDPVERLHAITATTRILKHSGEAATADRLLQATDLLPVWLSRRVTQAVNSQPLVSMVVTNIPGPDFPLYALGSRLLEAFPVVPLGAGMTLEVAILSYDGQLNLSVTADRESCPDADVFTAGVTHTFAELGAGWTPAASRS